MHVCREARKRRRILPATVHARRLSIRASFPVCNRMGAKTGHHRKLSNEEKTMHSRTLGRRAGMLRAALAASALALATQASAVTEIQWWHAMTGANNDRVNAFAKRFNESQSDYKVTAV